MAANRADLSIAAETSSFLLWSPTCFWKFGPRAKKECGRCLLTKFGLAQFTARLFWRFGDQWHLAVNIFDSLPPHTVAARYLRPIHTPRHKTHFRSTRALHSKAASQCRKPVALP
jgi:hypothetical protein